jgi:hypothetical protein
MRKYGFWFDVVVRDDERGFLSRDGRFVRLLAPGRFTSFDPAQQLSVEVVKVVRTEIATERALLLQRTHRPVAEQNFESCRRGRPRSPSSPSTASPSTSCRRTRRAPIGRR